VTRAPLLHIETLDAGSVVAPDDGRLRAAVLRAAGFAPHLLTIEPGDGRATVRQALESRRFELALVASSNPGGEPAARWLPAGLPAHWWPGGLYAGALPRRMPWQTARALAAIGGRDAGAPAAGCSATAATHAALDWVVLDEAALARRRLPLWDGDYLLAPAALAGTSGRQLLAAFAAVALDHDALDLIVLADPQPDFERLARGLGVGTRVHFVGRATREAEWSWLKPASGVLIVGPGPIAAGTVVRALACGCPVLGAGAEGVGPALNAWLADRGAAVAVGGSTIADLRRILDRPAPIDLAIERGRRASEAHRVTPLAARLSAALAAGAPVAAVLPLRRVA
jgi:hypothetical protein